MLVWLLVCLFACLLVCLFAIRRQLIAEAVRGNPEVYTDAFLGQVTPREYPEYRCRLPRVSTQSTDVSTSN